MSTYEISYAGLDDAAAQAKAVADIKSYLGDDEFDRMSTVIRQCVETGEIVHHRQLLWPLAMVGVQGYPVRAWWLHLFGDYYEWRDPFVQ